MQKTFKDPSDLTRDLRELAGHGLIAALKAAGDPSLDPEKRIHGVRTQMKKLRALLRLIRADFPDYALENKAARDAAHGLSATRDAAVMQQTLASLHPDGAEDASDLPKLVDALDRQAPTGVDEEQALHDFSQAALSMRDRVTNWTLKRQEDDVLASGAAALYRAARKRPRTDQRAADPIKLHEWRKHVKYLMNARGLLAGFGTALPDKKALHRLSDLLGEHHDLQVLRDFISARLDADTFAPLLKRIRKEQMKRQRAAGQLADTLFGSKPKAVHKAIGQAVRRGSSEAPAAVN